MEKAEAGDYIIPNTQSGDIDNITSTIKDQTNLLMQSIAAFSEKMEVARSYSDFERIKREINEFLMHMFADVLKGKSADFILWFEQSNISKFHTENEIEKVELIKVLVLKNRFYTETLRSIISLGKLDAILWAEGREDALNMIESGIFSFLDEIYVNWYTNIYNGANEGIKSDKLVYGGVKDGKTTDLASLSDKEVKIDDEKLAKIHDVNIRTYLLAFSKFIQEGTTDYNAWIGAEISEVKSWQDRENIFWVVAPMEDYIYPGLLIEPELIIFLRDLNKKVNFEDFYGLSEQYFGERYGMDHMTLDFVEALLQTGDATFCGFIGKAFPNDTELSKREGNCIILKDNTMKNVVKNAQKWMKALFWDDFEMDDTKLYNELIKEVTYHEFGHSLFIKGHGSSLLEEAKATLFYYLQIFQENKTKPYALADIVRVVEFTVMDSIRNIERINDSSSKKYVILTKLNLSFMFSSGLLFWEDNELVINAGKENFETFIMSMKDMLSYIKILYEMDETTRLTEETSFLVRLESQIQEDISKMVEILK